MAQHIYPRLRDTTSTDLFTIVFKNGQRLLHQDPMSLAQFRFDARLAAVLKEPTTPRTTSCIQLRRRDLSS
jgi:hypothetical protein